MQVIERDGQRLIQAKDGKLYSNKHNVADIFVRAVVDDDYTRGEADYSVTDLIRPVKQLLLARRHEHEIVRDVSDMFAIFRGKAIHAYMEQFAAPNTLVEERVYANVGGVIIGGKSDGYAVGIKDERRIGVCSYEVYDLKSTSVWSFIYGDKPEWEMQLNSYAYLWRVNGFHVDTLTIYAALYDWNRNEARRNPDYPQTPVHTVSIPLWKHEDVALWLSERVKRIKLAEDMNDNQLPPCDSMERWESPTTWAVMKGENKRATRVFDSCDKAHEFIDAHNDAKKLRIEERPGEWKRCANYCDALPWCGQAAHLREAE